MKRLIKILESIKDITGKIKDIAAGINKAILYGIILVSITINLVNLFLHPKEHIKVQYVSQNVLKTITITNTPPVRYVNGKTITNTEYITIEQAQDEVNQWHTNSFTNDWQEPYLTVTLPNSYGNRWEKVKITASDNYKWLLSAGYDIIPGSGGEISAQYRPIQILPFFIGAGIGYDYPNNVRVNIKASFLLK